MKKSMLALSLFTPFFAFSAPLDRNASTESDYRVVFNAVMNIEAQKDAIAYADTNNFWSITHRNDLCALRMEADEAFAARGFSRAPYSVSKWPKMSERVRRENGMEEAFSRSIQTAKRLGSELNAGCMVRSNATLDDIVVYLQEYLRYMFSHQYFSGIAEIDCIKTAIQKLAVKQVKKYLRRQGKSFVSKDGVNPCEALMMDLNNALNAPRLSGLDTWLRNIGCAALDLSVIPSAEEVSRLKGDVLDGEVEMSHCVSARLYICLGVDEYNKFVKEYNGD